MATENSPLRLRRRHHVVHRDHPDFVALPFDRRARPDLSSKRLYDLGVPMMDLID